MKDADGEKLIDKYVKKIPEDKSTKKHVGGSLPKKDEPFDKLSINKLGLDSARDY